jgi:aspartate/methionine/tyrosine aminotransferase
VAAFHSLSKRSTLPGLRVGFCAGDAEFIAALAGFRNVVGPQLPLPVQNAAAAIWREESHVETNRALYREKFEMADAILAGRFGYARPQGGLYRCLDTSEHGCGTSAVNTFWPDCAVRLPPCALLARSAANGANPGADYVRLAMVADPDETREALTRMVTRLE